MIFPLFSHFYKFQELFMKFNDFFAWSWNRSEFQWFCKSCGNPDIVTSHPQIPTGWVMNYASSQCAGQAVKLMGQLKNEPRASGITLIKPGSEILNAGHTGLTNNFFYVNHPALWGEPCNTGYTQIHCLWHIHIWGHWCQKQVSQAGISNCIPQSTVGCNYLSLPEIPASGTKVLI